MAEGRWVTINGHHVLINEDGTPVNEKDKKLLAGNSKKQVQKKAWKDMTHQERVAEMQKDGERYAKDPTIADKEKWSDDYKSEVIDYARPIMAEKRRSEDNLKESKKEDENSAKREFFTDKFNEEIDNALNTDVYKAYPPSAVRKRLESYDKAVGGFSEEEKAKFNERINEYEKEYNKRMGKPATNKPPLVGKIKDPGSKYGRNIPKRSQEAIDSGKYNKYKQDRSYENAKTVQVNGREYKVWGDTNYKGTFAEDIQGNVLLISGSGYLTNELSQRKAIANIFGESTFRKGSKGPRKK